MNFPPKTVVSAYFPACVLRAKGVDAPAFLNSQFSNDLSKMTTGGSVYGLWLDRKGRVVADSWVILLRSPDEFLIVSLDCPASAVEAHLQTHIIADEVEVTDESAGWRGLALIGAGTGEALLSGPSLGVSFPGRRGGGEAHEWLVPVAGWTEALSAAQGLGRLAEGELELLRIRGRIPRIGQDIGPSDIPNEGGLDRDAISYSKGCYTGQEVMARVKALGRVRRALVLVSGGGEPPALPASLWAGGVRAGELRSAAGTGPGFEGLALVAVEPAARYSLAPDGPAAVEVLAR